MLVIIDYGMGNVASIQNMLLRLGHLSIISRNEAEIQKATRIILPGVGAFDTAMRNLQSLGLVEVLTRKVRREGTPLLGICLGMQILSTKSEEGTLPGLGWIEAETVRFRFDPSESRCRVPHMGWASIQPCQPHPLMDGLGDQAKFYFVHSYHVRCAAQHNVLATATHGVPFHAVVGSGNIVGTQFHPEKSHKHGMRLLENFVGMKPL